MKLLIFSSLYPDSTRPRHGIFVETRLQQLLAHHDIEAKVIAPVPWFPLAHAAFGSYAAYAHVPRAEMHNGICVNHPRYLHLPKVGMSIAPWLMARAAIRKVHALMREGFEFDAIDAHYFYPDGVAAALIARQLGKPLVITARGSDLNLLTRYALPRRWIRWAANQATHLVTVSGALKQILIDLGVAAEKITVLRNGVDTVLFTPVVRETMRATLDFRDFVMLSVGNLVAAKGHDLAIAATARIPDAHLVIIGEGADRTRLTAFAATLGVTDRVRFVGNMQQDALRNYYGAADALILASAREGWPNVLLEAMACGTPVVAANTGGTPEIITAPEAGLLLTARSVDAIVSAIQSLRARMPDRGATRTFAERFGWDETSAGQLRIFNQIRAQANA